MSDLNKEAESLVEGLFGANVVDQRFNSSDKLNGASSVMSEMAKEKQGTYDIASTLLDKQFKLKNAETQQALRTHIINLSNGVDVKLQESELKSLIQLTGKSEEELLEEFPNLKLTDNSSQSEEKLDNESRIEDLGLLSESDSIFLLSNILCHDNVTKTLKGLNVDTENLTVEVFTTQICKAIVKTLSKVKADIEDQKTLISVVELLHKVAVVRKELNDQQLIAFTTLVKSFYVEPKMIDVELVDKKEAESNEGTEYLNDDEDNFVRNTINNCRALTLECNTLKITLDKPIDFDEIGVTNLERLIVISNQQKNANKNKPEYVRLVELLNLVVSKM